jgi:hypothetical protein
MDDLDPTTLSALDQIEQDVIVRARHDPAVFASYVMKDDETHTSVVLQDMHYEWHDLLDQHKNVLIWSHIEAGKTSQISICRALYEIGRNPEIRIAIVSNTAGMAKKICMAISKYILDSPEFQKVFPDIKPAEDMPWTAMMLSVQRKSRAKDPTLQTCGLHGNILGSRIDLLILDDFLDYESTLSAALREDTKAWYKSTLEGRCTQNARVWCVGTAWDKDDIMHDWARSPRWYAVRYPVIRDGVPTWPAKWPLERIQDRREALGVVEFNRQLMCTARSDADSRFKRAWIDKALAAGEGRNPCLRLNTSALPEGYRTITGVDLAVSQRDSADFTAIVTLLIHPDETREILEVVSGRWSGPDIVDRIIDVHDRFHSIVYVESNAAQAFILQFTRGRSAVPVRPFNTGNNKHSPEFGIESIAAEMEAGKWIIPNNPAGHLHPEVHACVTQALYYDPRTHTGDHLMALWIAREGARQTKVHHGVKSWAKLRR